MQPLINGQAYAWSQIKLATRGTVIVGISKITYSDEQQMEDMYGAGNNPVRRGYGRYSAKCSLTIHMEELEGLAQASPTGRIQDLPEDDIIVSFLPIGGVIVNHTLHNIRFKNNGRDMKEGDMGFETDIECLVSHISWK